MEKNIPDEEFKHTSTPLREGTTIKEGDYIPKKLGSKVYWQPVTQLVIGQTYKKKPHAPEIRRYTPNSVKFIMED